LDLLVLIEVESVRLIRDTTAAIDRRCDADSALI